MQSGLGLALTVNLTLALMGLVTALAVLCGVILIAVRRQPAMVWMGLALCIGVAESLALKDGDITALDKVLTCITIPLSYTCVGQSVRAAYGARRSSGRFFALVIALIAASLALIYMGAPPVVQTLFCQLAGVLAMADAIMLLLRERAARDRIDSMLLATLVCVTAVYAVRIPFFPMLIDEPTPFAIAGLSRVLLQDMLVVIFGILVPACVFLVVARVVVNAIDAYRLRAERDYLTQLPNRSTFEELASRYRGSGGVLVLCDIDNFKLVNDRFGHAAGDAVICAFASLIDGPGFAARIGGEEFAILYPDCSAEKGKAHADCLRREFETLKILEVADDHPLTASFGIAPFGPHSPLELLMAQADAALYAAKNSGRNRVVMHGVTEDCIPPVANSGANRGASAGKSQRIAA